MKATIQKLLVLMLVSMTLTLVNCSKGSSNDATPAASVIGTSCGANMIQSTRGCLPQCGVGMVTYNNNCVSAHEPANGQFGNQYGHSNQYNTGYNNGGITQNQAICRGTCGEGQTAMTNGQGRQSCLPQYSCGPCYGYDAQSRYCYEGTYARQYYGM